MTNELLSLMPTNNVVVLTPEQAEAKAIAYLTSHSVPLEGLRPSVKLVDHGDFSQYEVTWQGYVGDIAVPDLRTASVDPSNGAVFGFADFRRSYAPPPTPGIGRDEAITRAKAFVSSGAAFQSPTLDGAELKVDFAPDG